MLFSKKTAPPPPRIPSDTVIPLRFMDTLYPMSIDFAFLFPHPLDPNKLREALHTLLDRPGWRELGARLRRSESGQFEYHVPENFTKERPSVLFTTAKHESSIREHAVLRNIPKLDTSRPAIIETPCFAFRSSTRPPSGPEVLDDWLHKDIPQFAVHVITFQDATIINSTMLHTLTDLMGMVAFYRAWTLTLHGKDDEVAPFIGADYTDPLESMHKQVEHKPQPYIHAHLKLTKWSLFKLGLRQMFERLWYPGVTLRFFTLPKEFVEKLVAAARSELALAYWNDSSTPFISDSDIVCAWWKRLLVQCHNPRPDSTVCIINNFDVRPILAEMGLLPSIDTSYVGNAIYQARAFGTATSFLGAGSSLGGLAYSLRNSIKDHRTISQSQAQDMAMRKSVQETGRLPAFGTSDMRSMVMTNLYRGRLFQLDFSPAIVSQNGSNEKLTAFPEWINCTGWLKGPAPRDTSSVLGRTERGDWWLSSRLREDIWEKLRGIFERL